MSDQLMLDIEALGKNNRAAITQIGAVAFNVEQGVINHFYIRVDPETSVAAGMKIDVSTVLWWLKQSDAARAEFEKGPQVSIHAALKGLSEFCGKHLSKDSGVWGNGVRFDNEILVNAYDLCGIEQPWKYWQDRCYRTIKGLLKSIPVDDYGVAHNGLDDAIKQANHLIKICRTTGLVL